MCVCVTLSLGLADLGCHGDGWQTALATMTDTADFGVISASYLRRQTSAIYIQNHTWYWHFFHNQARKALKNTLNQFCGPSVRNVVIGAS